MITATDFYHVMTAMVPLYVAMILAYGSVKWWKIFTPTQCSGINRFVALFAVPLLSFHFIAANNPYAMNLRFLAADSLQKLILLSLLFLWCKLCPNGSLDWTNHHHLLANHSPQHSSHGDTAPQRHHRGAKFLIPEQFPYTAGSIVSNHVDSDIMSLDGRQPLETEAQTKEDGKLHVTVRRSNASRSDIFSTSDFYSMMAGGGGGGRNSNFGPGEAVFGSKGLTPRPSNYEEFEENI
ncbi:hypothetical protein Bca101_098973 [Brassica carinata]